jgi:hypothetical protein
MIFVTYKKIAYKDVTYKKISNKKTIFCYLNKSSLQRCYLNSETFMVKRRFIFLITHQMVECCSFLIHAFSKEFLRISSFRIEIFHRKMGTFTRIDISVEFNNFCLDFILSKVDIPCFLEGIPAIASVFQNILTVKRSIFCP